MKVSADNYQVKNELFHRFFYKEFALDNTAEIRKSEMKLFTDCPVKLRLNDKWVNQSVKT